MDAKEQYRFFLKDTIRKSIDFRLTDQSRGIPAPPLEKPFDADGVRIRLPQKDLWEPAIPRTDLVSAMAGRKSRRAFSSSPLSLEELDFLLWATQGLRQEGGAAYRTVPSAGARHSFETYLFVRRVEGVPEGLYRYLPMEQELLLVSATDRMDRALAAACFGQTFVSRGAVTFVWTTVPYRMEWRYGLAAHRVILLDAGHVCQNLYLACEAIGAGTCAIGAYDQEALDLLLGVDGQEEFAVYLAPVGKTRTAGAE